MGKSVVAAAPIRADMTSDLGAPIRNQSFIACVSPGSTVNSSTDSVDTSNFEGDDPKVPYISSKLNCKLSSLL